MGDPIYTFAKPVRARPWDGEDRRRKVEGLFG
jgi:hypothetical protein